MSRSVRLVGAALLVAVLALYARALGGAFVVDDRTFFVENDDLTRLPLSEAATVFARPTNAWGDWQPVRDLLFLAEYRAFGRSTAGYHAVSILLYAATCLLAYALARALGGGGEGSDPAGRGTAEAGAALAAFLFVTHPTHVEAVAYVCGQKELLSALFSLAALLLFWRAFGEERGRSARLVGGVACFGLAILSKQTAVMLSVLVPLLWLLSNRERRPRAVPAAALWAAVNVPAAFWMIRSRDAFQALWGVNSALTTPPWPERVPLALKVLGAHARLAVWPHPLSFGYPFDPSPRWDGALVVGLVTLAAAAALCVVFRRDRVVVFGVASFLGFLVPVLQLHGSLVNASVYDRYLFLPVLGLALVLARSAGAVARRWPRARAGALGVLGAAALAGAVLSFRYLPAFRDDVAVTRNTFEQFPGWSRAPFELAYALLEAGRPAEARGLIAVERSFDQPPWVRPYLDGWATLVEGRPSEAVPALSWATDMAVRGGYFPFPAIPLGRALIATGRLDEARRVLLLARDVRIYQPLEVFHARQALAEIAVRKGESLP